MASVNDILKIAKSVNPAAKAGMDLITSGIYNSIEIVALVVELESAYGIRISPRHIDADHFNRLESIAELVNMYLEEKSAGRKVKEITLDPSVLAEIGQLESAEQNVSVSSVKVETSFAGVAQQADVGADDFRLPAEDASVLDFVTNAAAQAPEKVAVSDQNGNRLTYAELLNQSQAVGTYLAEKFGCTKQPFMVVSRRNVRSIVMVLGVLWSGNYYIPVDEELPFEQLEKLLELARPEAVLWHYNARHDEIFDLDADVNIYDDMIEIEPDADALTAVQAELGYDDPLFGVFTSGTMGRRKCVVKSRGAMAEFIRGFAQKFGFTHRDVLGSKLALMFDAFTKDLYTTLYCGATLHIMPMGNVMPSDDAAFVQAAGVTAVVWTPSLLRSFVQLHILEEFDLPSLKKVLFVGEALPAKYLNAWMQHKPDALYVNLYGTTEMTGNCLYQVIDAPVATEVVPLRDVFPGYEVFLEDESGKRITAAGTVGELCAASRMLCTAQLGEEMAPEHFPKDAAGNRYYRTGDMARLEADGTLVFTARKDAYFKHAGYRISPDEIEEPFSELPCVELAVCCYDTEHGKITLFWQGDEGQTDALYARAKEALQPYQQPGAYVHMDALPLNRSGKVDRAALSRMLRESN